MESLITDTSTHPVIGVFPNNWEFSRFGREFERSNERNGDSPIGPMLSVSEYRGIEVRTNFRDGQLPSEDVSHYRVVRPGQLVANLMWLDHGGLGVSHFAGYVSPAYMAFNISERVAPAFAHHVLRSSVYVDSYKRLGRGVRPNSQMVDSVDLRQLPFPLPPFETQQRIADYLDRETAEIDAAVADLDKYVELLEKRKLSRLESALHDVNYRMCPVGLIANVTLGKMVSTTPPKSDGVERQYLRAAHVQPGGRIDFTVTEKKMWFSEKELERLDLRAGDVVVVEGGAGFGRSAYFEYDLEGWGFQNSINRVRVDPSKADSRFVQLMLNRALLNGSIGISVDTATLPHFTAEKLARFRIPICDIQNQKAFSQEIYEDQLATDSLIAKSTKLRDLLLKRRSVLITEVVTGRKQV